jgi:hypothetical protein
MYAALPERQLLHASLELVELEDVAIAHISDSARMIARS